MFSYCGKQDFLYILMRYQLTAVDDPHMKGTTPVKYIYNFCYRFEMTPI